MRQPQTTRQQFSACGACRTRRIRCDLKDICEAALLAGETPSCSTCQERDLICTYEFNEMKAQKILRRGRRIKQVEAMYGKQNSLSPTESRGQSPLFPQPGERLYTLDTIPKLKPQFFDSPFWRSFHVQRPILDPVEFSKRYQEHYSNYHDVAGGSADIDSLGPAGHLISSLLVIWAASFGVDESGSPISTQGNAQRSMIDQWRTRTDDMVKEALERVDSLGLLRKPSWDGVRALLLLLPLTSDVLPRAERQVIHESTMSQVCTLCNLSSSHGNLYVDPVVRARIFWYAYTMEGIIAGSKGARLFLSSDDFVNFQSTIPQPSGNLEYNSGCSSGPLPSNDLYDLAYRLASTPLRISDACRQVQAFRKRSSGGNYQASSEEQNSVKNAFSMLAMAWFELDQFHQMDTKGFLHQEDRNRFICTWKIVIFECFYTISDSLYQLKDDPSSIHLASIASRKCHELIPYVLTILRSVLSTPFFAFDSGLAHRGVACAALSISRLSESDFSNSPSAPSRNEALEICIQALKQMRWCYSDTEKAIEKLGAALISEQQRVDPSAQYLLTPPITPPTFTDQHRSTYDRYSSTTSWSSGQGDLTIQTHRRSPSSSASSSTSAIYVPSYDCLSPTSPTYHEQNGAYMWS